MINSKSELENIQKTDLNQPPQPFTTSKPNTTYLPKSKKSKFSNSRTAINQNKDLNLHKLWPHSLKQQQQQQAPSSQNNDQTYEKPVVISSESVETPPTAAVSSEVIPTGIDNSKTPLCIINELVRFNKIKHEYILLDEIGPAHKKTFFIQLKLGGGDSSHEETYTASGSSIKKTQHAVAQIALTSTKFQAPQKRDIKEKTRRMSGLLATKLTNDTDCNIEALAATLESVQVGKRKEDNNKTVNPPTVRLNTLAMKLGLVANYTHTISVNQHSVDLSQTNYTNFTSSDYKPFNYSVYPSSGFAKEFENFPRQKFYGNTRMPHKLQVLYNPRLPMSQQQQQQQQQQVTNFYSVQAPTLSVIPKQIIHVKLTFANKEFTGKGFYLQQAKHDAAEKALQYFTQPTNFLEAKSLANSSVHNSNSKAYRPPQFRQDGTVKPENSLANGVDEDEAKNIGDDKSEVQMVHEYANFLKKSVEYEIIKESGASHSKTFVTKCSLVNKKPHAKQPQQGNNPEPVVDSVVSEMTKSADRIEESDGEGLNFETTSEGSSKRVSKKNAAVKMLEILKEKFEPLFLVERNRSEEKLEKTAKEVNEFKGLNLKKNRKSKAKNIIKIKKTCPDYGKGTINPISRLMQIQQAKKEKEPIFEAISALTEPHKDTAKTKQREFFIQCRIDTFNEQTKTMQTLKSEGKGTTKKQAKQKAAEEMLLKLGYQVTATSILKPSLKVPSQVLSSAEASSAAMQSLEDQKQSRSEKNDKKVKFLDVVATSSPDITNTTTLTTYSSTALNTQINSLNKVNQKKPIVQKPVSEAYKNYLSKQKKLRTIQESISNKDLISSNGCYTAKNLKDTFQIAYELLESVKQNSDLFSSATAQRLLKESGRELVVNSDIPDETEEEKKLRQVQFDLLNAGRTVSYKKMLEYLSDTIGFKVNYQSLLGRDGSVNSYVNLSILLDTDKPLNGNGSTHIESSNNAALCALQYLASKWTVETVKPPQETT